MSYLAEVGHKLGQVKRVVVEQTSSLNQLRNKKTLVLFWDSHRSLDLWFLWCFRNMICIILVAGHGTVLETEIKVQYFMEYILKPEMRSICT